MSAEKVECGVTFSADVSSSYNDYFIYASKASKIHAR